MAFSFIGRGREGFMGIVYNLAVKTVFAASHLYYYTLFPAGFFQGGELLIVLIWLPKKAAYGVSTCAGHPTARRQS